MKSSFLITVLLPPEEQARSCRQAAPLTQHIRLGHSGLMIRIRQKSHCHHGLLLTEQLTDFGNVMPRMIQQRYASNDRRLPQTHNVIVMVASHLTAYVGAGSVCV